MTHNPAPAIVDVPPPYRTPGTRLAWATAGEWLDAMIDLHRRRCSAQAYQAQAAHMDELARHPRLLHEAESNELLGIRAFICAPGNRPARGRRGGTSWNRILCSVNNAIAYTEQLERGVHVELLQLLKED